MYDGPFCVPSIADNRTFRRILFEVLDHDPTHADIERFFRRFQLLLKERGLEVKGITTDGSNLYPDPISKVFGGVPHQSCEFHVIRELTKAVLRAVARVRKELAATKPKLGRGRPESRTLREILDEVYRLFDRRRRTATALDKLARLRHRVRRFKKVGKTLQKLFSPNLEKALTFLDDKLLPSTSNAVERGYRRHRKMQKTVYRVRTLPNLTARIALDMQREQRAPLRDHTTATLHATRARTAA